MPFQDVQQLPGGRIPDSGRLVPTSGDDPLTVGEKRDGPDRSRVSFEREQFLAGFCISDLRGMIRTPGSDPLAIRRVSHGQNRPGVSAKRH